MNLFVLDNDMAQLADYHSDTHTSSQPKEGLQIMCFVHHWFKRPCGDTFTDGTPLYKPNKAHMKHPCTLWAMQSLDNYHWTRDYVIAVAEEKWRRYDKPHRCGHLVQLLPDPPASCFATTGLTPFAIAVKGYDFLRKLDPVVAYRSYYVLDKFPNENIRWDRRGGKPDFFTASY